MPDAFDRQLEDLDALEAHVRATQGDAAWEVMVRFLGSPPKRRRKVPERVGNRDVRREAIRFVPSGEPTLRDLHEFDKLRGGFKPYLDRIRVAQSGTFPGSCRRCSGAVHPGEEFGRVHTTRATFQYWCVSCLASLRGPQAFS